MRKRPLWEQRVLIAVSKGNKKIARRLQKETANWLTWGSLTHLRSELRKSTYTYWISLIYGQSVTHTLLLLNRNWCVREPQRACRTTHMFNTLQRGFEAWNGTKSRGVLWVGYWYHIGSRMVCKKSDRAAEDCWRHGLPRHEWWLACKVLILDLFMACTL